MAALLLTNLCYRKEMYLLNYKLLFLIILAFSIVLTIYKLIKVIWISLKKFIFKSDDVLISPKDLCGLTPKEFQSFSNFVLEKQGFSSLSPIAESYNDESYFLTSRHGENYGVLCIKEYFSSKSPSSINYSTFKRFIAILHHNNLSHGIIVHSRTLNKEKHFFISSARDNFDFIIYDGDIVSESYNLLSAGETIDGWELK